MGGVTIRRAGEADLGRLDTGLRQLSAALGDAHSAARDDLHRACFGAGPVVRAMIAERGEALLGIALFSPVFSTMRGAIGLYVSDLWVDETARGAGLGRRLLAAAAREGNLLWDARFLRLVVYDDNPSARAFYRKLGFSDDRREILMTLDEAGIAALKGQP